MREILSKINIDDYNYDLPEERIAQYPVKVRDTSRLLLYINGKISDDIFRNIDKYIPDKSLLVFNNTRVIKARLLFQKKTGANIEILCLEPLEPIDYQQSLSSTSPVEWNCMIGNLKKWKKGKLLLNFRYKGIQYDLTAQKIGKETDALRIRFEWDSDDISFGEILIISGHIPLPPYVNRKDDNEDNIRYQTVYSKIEGSVAAPTAGLHFTDDVLNNIRNKGIEPVEITLHVGAGTFQPVRTKNIEAHEMHCEQFYFRKKLIDTLLHYRGNIIAVGTTSVRTLESIYWLGVKVILEHIKTPDGLSVGQWEPYQADVDVSLEESLHALSGLFEEQEAEFINASTRIMIVPGYKFRVIDGMITNFHQPKSTLLLLVSAWAGIKWEDFYRYALKNNFRFLSFGDASLLLK